MSGRDIFISYSREDRPAARHFAESFAREGFSVWWDAVLRSGETFDEVIEKELRAAKAVVVLWSPRSVASRWVRAEATLADRGNKLVPGHHRSLRPADHLRTDPRRRPRRLDRRYVRQPLADIGQRFAPPGRRRGGGSIDTAGAGARSRRSRSRLPAEPPLRVPEVGTARREDPWRRAGKDELMLALERAQQGRASRSLPSRRRRKRNRRSSTSGPTNIAQERRRQGPLPAKA